MNNTFSLQNHYYQPMWTLVGGGVKSFEESGKKMSEVLPKNADWIKSSVTQIDADRNKVYAENGDEISYEFLVVAMGMSLKYDMVTRACKISNTHI